MNKDHRVSRNFVSPAPETRIVEIETVRDLPSPPIVQPMPNSNYWDRSRGFVLATAPLAAATGFVVFLIGISAFGVPVLSVVALLLALGGFTFAWLIAYALHTFVSAEGALFLHVAMMWRLLFLEARERRRRYGKH